MPGSWLVGSTVRILIVVTDPASGALADPTTTTFLTLTRDGVPVVATPAVTRLSQGSYEIRLDTSGYQPGTYVWLVSLTDAQSGVALVRDQFVLGAVA